MLGTFFRGVSWGFCHCLTLASAGCKFGVLLCFLVCWEVRSGFVWESVIIWLCLCCGGWAGSNCVGYAGHGNAVSLPENNHEHDLRDITIARLIVGTRQCRVITALAVAISI